MSRGFFITIKNVSETETLRNFSNDPFNLGIRNFLTAQKLSSSAYNLFNFFWVSDAANVLKGFIPDRYKEKSYLTAK